MVKRKSKSGLFATLAAWVGAFSFTKWRQSSGMLVFSLKRFNAAFGVMIEAACLHQRWPQA